MGLRHGNYFGRYEQEKKLGSGEILEHTAAHNLTLISGRTGGRNDNRLLGGDRELF